MNKTRKLTYRLLSMALVAALIVGFLPAPKARADVAAPPTIMRDPSDGTFATGAVLRLYVTAVSQTDSPLTYTWSAKKVEDDTETTVEILPADNGKSVLTTTAPSAAGTYEYTVTVTDKNGSSTASAKIKVVDRTLEDHIINGDFSAIENKGLDNGIRSENKGWGSFPNE
ncbi:MAG: hypothetical protein LBC21_02345, partial [Oscillospiraceae bacterium]|nr:hypothetical protein [Oscillospiraceae bacterium]